MGSLSRPCIDARAPRARRTNAEKKDVFFARQWRFFFPGTMKIRMNKEIMKYAPRIENTFNAFHAALTLLCHLRYQFVRNGRIAHQALRCRGPAGMSIITQVPVIFKQEGSEAGNERVRSKGGEIS